MSATASRPKPRYLITIDTEGDDQWSRSDRVTTENARFLPRFQALCDEFGFKPTYLTNFEMATSPTFQAFGREVLRAGTAEIGMHLHAWHSPPDFRLTEDDYKHHPYLIEYPADVIRAKVDAMTSLLEKTFERPIVSHRAGRWGFNEVYARVLADRGYLVDCSVTPGLSWAKYKGKPDGSGGPDFTGYPLGAYFLNLDDIRKPGNSPLLEVPMTVRTTWSPIGRWLHARVKGAHRLLRAPVNRLFPPVVRLQPTGRNLRHLLSLQRQALREGVETVEFTLHSSEFMPGGSPTFPNHASIERLYRDMARLFRSANRDFAGSTLAEYRATFGESRP